LFGVIRQKIPFLLAGDTQMSTQSNTISIQVTSGSTVLGTVSEKVLQVGMHDQNRDKPVSLPYIRDLARILPLGKSM
jgi:hypothetical protein